MTLSEVIAKVQELKPSEYDKVELTQWVNEVEFMAVDQVINRAEPKPGETDTEYKAYDYELDAERELLIPDQFSDCYISYLFSKIDFNNAEIERYNLDAAQFEAEWQAYAAWYRRSHFPRRARERRPPCVYHS